jgi:hypothetical protein
MSTENNEIKDYLKNKVLSQFEHCENESQFINTKAIENRYVGFLEDGKIIHIEETELKEIGKNYKELISEFPEIKFYNQRIGENLEIATEDNLQLIEKHEESLKVRSTIKNKNTAKTTKSIKKHL